MIFLKNYQREIGSSRTSEMLMNLRELCSAAQAKSIILGMAQCVDFMSYDIPNRRNYTELRHRFCLVPAMIHIISMLENFSS